MTHLKKTAEYNGLNVNITTKMNVLIQTVKHIMIILHRKNADTIFVLILNVC